MTDLAARYLNTELVFELPEHGGWLLRPNLQGADSPQFHSPSEPTAELHEALGLAHPALVITAANPLGENLDPKLNQLRNTRLYWGLRNLDLEPIPCLGRSLDQQHSEASFWVPTRGLRGVDLAVTSEALRYGQNAIFKVSPDSMQLVGICVPELSGATKASWWRAGGNEASQPQG